MNILIFKTNLEGTGQVDSVKQIFNNHQSIQDWNVDTTDIDKVLRIEANDNLLESDIIQLLSVEGYFCDVLPD